MEKLPQMSELDKRLKSYPLPTKFMKAYIEVLLIIGLVMDSLNLVARISEPSLTGLEGTPTLYNFYIVYGTVYVIVRFITYMHLKACQKSGYILNYFFLVLFILYAVLFVNITVAMLYLIYGICVMVYFYKRKSLFDPGYSAVPTVPEAPAPGADVAPVSDLNETTAATQSAETVTSQPKPVPIYSSKENRIDSLVKNGTIGLLATNTALFYYIIRYVFPYGTALDVDQALFAAAIIDTAPYWKTNEMTKHDVERALDLAKAGTVKIGGYEVSHSLVSSDSEKELLYNLSMQLQAMKHYVDNNVDERDPVDMVVNFKSQIISIIDDTLRAGQNHPKYNDALRIVTEYMDRQDYWELVFNYGLDPKAIEEMKAHKNNTQHKLGQPPAANHPAPEIDITPEPAPPVELDPEPAPDPEPVKDPTSIDLSGLTDEQRALVSQLVDSMKK